jgi:hypothetical protein
MQHAIADYTHSNESAAAELDAVTHALERLLTRHQPVLKEEGMDRQVQNLKRWLEDNREHFAAAKNFPETGNAWLSDLCDSLKLAVEERQRLESEGGLPATQEQDEQNEELLNTVRRIEKILDIDSSHS